MASAVSYEGPYYTGNNSISFRSLQTNFGGNSNNVKFSTYYRNTDVDESDPIVPDSTENTTIPTSGTIEASDFRDSIKKYYVTQTGGESNYDIDAQSWNSNLAKNILKESRIDGTVSSSRTSNTAATFNATAYNMKIVVSGAVYGHEGYGANPKNNGTAASSAMLVNNTSTRTATASNVTVRVNSAGKIYGGGGGGGGGGDGSGGSISCYNEWGYGRNTHTGEYGLVQSQGCGGCDGNSTSPEGFSGGLHSRQCFGSRGRSRCRVSNPKSGGGQGAQGEACNADWDVLCVYRRNVTLSSGGGTGGNGGHGQGANRLNTPQSGNGGNSGGRAYCAANNTRATGNSGGSGGRGGYFGERGSDGGGRGAGSGGAAGAAIYRSGGRPYNVQGATSSNIKGSY